MRSLTAVQQTIPPEKADETLSVVDLEWARDGRLLVLGFSDAMTIYALPWGSTPSHVRMTLEGRGIVAFTKADGHKLLDAGWELEHPYVDLQVMAWVLDENQKLALDPLAWRYLKLKMDKRIRKSVKHGPLFVCDDGSILPIHLAPRKQVREYCRRDVQAEMILYAKLQQKLKKAGLWGYFTAEEVPFTKTLLDMERAGLPIDLEASERFRAELEGAHAKLAAILKADLPPAFNLNSPDQVSQHLFTLGWKLEGRKEIAEGLLDDGFIPDWRTSGIRWIRGYWPVQGLGLPAGARSEKTGRPSTSREALLLNASARSNAWVQQFLEWGKLETYLSTFLRKFRDIAQPTVEPGGAPWHRVYTHFNQTGTRTGRLSSSDPINLQNIPVRGPMGKRFRELFRQPEGGLPLLMGDYSQLETRIMAHFSQDPELLRIFQEEEDPFIALGSALFAKQLDEESPERQTTKTVWYALNYGAEADKISSVLTLGELPTTPDEAGEIIADLQSLLPAYFDWRASLIEAVHQDGHVTTLAGRRRRVKLTEETPWKLVSHGERAAANAVVQGSAADIVRRVMVQFRRPALELVLQVHDELMYRYLARVAPEQMEHDARFLKRAATEGHGFDLTVPLVFEPKLGYSWSEKG